MFKDAWPLVVVISLRFLGLFIILPVISFYAVTLDNQLGNSVAYKSLLIGLAVGGYSLTQIIFQTPFGYLGDKFNKKAVIVFGLVIFLIGSLVCAYADNIYMLIVGRFIQGAGAISGISTAYLSDLVSEDMRTRAMAFMGAGIFVTFIISMIFAPILNVHFGIKSLFLITAILSFLAIFLVIFVVKKPTVSYNYSGTNKLKDILNDKNLNIMYISNFLQKGLMTLAFTIIPLSLINEFKIPEEHFFYVYTPAAIFGIISLGLGSVLAEKYGKYKIVVVLGIVFFMLSYIFISFSAGILHNVYIFSFGVMLFFLGFCMVEPLTQSLTAKYSKGAIRALALSFCNTLGFVGSFCGSVLGAFLYLKLGLVYLGLIVSIVCLIWIFLAILLDNPNLIKVLYVPKDQIKDETKLSKIEGVVEYYTNDKNIVIKYDSLKTKEATLLHLIAGL